MTRNQSLPSRSEAKTGALLAVENASRHLSCGESLAQSGEYGIASSHMVLAAEEALKALVLDILSDGVALPPRAASAILTRHKPRHFAGAIMALMVFITEKWTSLIKTVQNDNPDTSSPEYWAARKHAVNGFTKELKDIADAAPGEASIIDTLEWWNQSDKIKQRGFYVDLESGEWVGPSSIGVADYQQAHSIAADLVTKMAEVIPFTINQSDEERQKRAQALNEQLAFIQEIHKTH